MIEEDIQQLKNQMAVLQHLVQQMYGEVSNIYIDGKCLFIDHNNEVIYEGYLDASSFNGTLQLYDKPKDERDDWDEPIVEMTSPMELAPYIAETAQQYYRNGYRLHTSIEQGILKKYLADEFKARLAVERRFNSSLRGPIQHVPCKPKTPTEQAKEYIKERYGLEQSGVEEEHNDKT